MTLARSTPHRASAVLVALALTTLWPSSSVAQDAREQAAPHHGPSPEANVPPNDLVKVVRESTARFRDVSKAG